MRCRVFAVVLSGLGLLACTLSLSSEVLAEGRRDVLVIRNVRVFDGTRVSERSTVVVQGGKIAAVGPDAEVPAGADVTDGSGQTLLPGLIDSHTHTLFPDHLKQALVFGVTTELDMFTDHRFAAEMRRQQAADGAPDRAHDSEGCLLISGEVVEGAPYPWAGAMFSPGTSFMAPTDLSSKKAISFSAKGDGKTYSLMLYTESRGYMPAIREFVAGPQWKRHTFRLSDLDGADGGDVAALLFSAVTAPGKFEFQVDDVQLE